MPEESRKKVRRPRRSRAEWAQIIERFDAGNESLADFCRREDISVSSFYQWRKRLPSVTSSAAPLLESAASPAPRFIELDGLPSNPAGGWQVELDLGDGVILRLRHG